MKAPLVRFGVAIDEPLLTAFDALVRERGCTRSELFRDLARAEVVRSKVRNESVDAIAALTIVYNHHVRDLTDRLTELQHEWGDSIRSSLHVHLNHDLCLEVIVFRGRSDRLQAFADRVLAMRGVKHGGIEIVSAVETESPHASTTEPEAHEHPTASPKGGKRALLRASRHHPHKH